MLLMHKDVPVANIVISNSAFQHVNEIYQKDRMPIGTGTEYPGLLDTLLGQWQKMRTIPYNRENIKEFTKRLDCSISEASLFCNFVSLTDCYWLKDEKSEVKWSDVNFHDQPFSNEFAEKILYSMNDKIKDIRVPDFTTDGVLPKVWVSINGAPYLVKAGGVKAANEVVASHVANILKIPHVDYKPFSADKTVMCISPCFVKDSNTDTINGLQLKKEYKLTSIRLYHYLCEAGFKNEANQMIQFINIIHNTDCHEKNFAILRDADSLYLKSFAPLYDSDTSFGVENTNDIKPFINNRAEQLNLSNKDIVLPEKSIIKDIIKETYEIFSLDKHCLKTALDDLENTYREVCYEIHSPMER